MKRNYYYQNRKMKRREEIIPLRTKILRLVGKVMANISLAGIIVAVILYSYDSPKEKMYQRQLSQVTSDMEMFDRKLDESQKILDGISDRDNNIYRVIFESEPIPESVRKGGIGGSDIFASCESCSDFELSQKIAKRLGNINTQLYVQSKSQDEINKLISNKRDMLASIPAILPVANKDLKRLASGFGYRIHPVEKIKKFHGGQDFSAPIGTEIYATGNGEVTFVGSESKMGKFVEVNHGYGYKTRYGHMQNFSVTKGQQITRGTIIGTVGKTGAWITNSTLHYEVWKDGVRVDPVDYYFNDLTPEEYEQMIEIASRHNQSFD